MRYSKEHKQETHARIVKKAATRLREKGAHGIGVADLMKDAGLTHGGFYAHFDSREALVIEAFNYAMDRANERWRKITAEVPPEKQNQRFVVQTGMDEGATPVKSLLKRMGPPILIDDLFLRGPNRTKANELVLGEEEGMADVGHSHYILNFGSNPYESHENYIPLVQRLISARVQNHAQLVTFDVSLSNTAGRSDVWYPVRPGTDMAVILALCKQILDQGLADKAFLTQWTNLSPDQILSYLAPYVPPRWLKKRAVCQLKK